VQIHVDSYYNVRTFTMYEYDPWYGTSTVHTRGFNTTQLAGRQWFYSVKFLFIYLLFLFLFKVGGDVYNYKEQMILKYVTETGIKCVYVLINFNSIFVLY